MLDLDQAQAFLSALSSQEGGDFHFSFQTFYHVRGEHHELTHTLHGTFDECKELLVDANRRGAGVFVCINRTNLEGIRASNVNAIRSLFIDDDDDSLSMGDFALPPNIVVRSKRGCHFYWLADLGDIGLADFNPYQKALARAYKTDETITNLNRVMRLPGFLHHKGDPFLVTLEHVDTYSPYTKEELRAGLDLEVVVHERRDHESGSVRDVPLDTRIRRCRGFLRKAIGPAERGSGDGHRTSLRACRAGHDFGLSEEEFTPLLLEWGATCEPAWSDHKLLRFFRSSLQSQSEAFGNRLFDENYQSHSASPRALSNDPTETWRDSEVPWSTDEMDEEAAPAKVHSSLTLVPDLPDDMPEWIFEDIPVDAKGTSRSRIIAGPERLPEPTASAPKSGGTGRIGESIDSGDDSLELSDQERAGRDIAARLVSEYHIRRDDAKCIYVYQNNVWNETSREFLEKLSMQYDTHNHMEMKILREAVNLALTRRHVQEIPWNRLSNTEVAVRNGVLDFMTGKVRRHDPDDYIDRILPFDFDPSAACPRWELALEEWLPGGEEEKTGLQQFFGYILMAHARYKKALLLFGDPDTGKSQICYVAQELAGGHRAVCSITPDEMDDPRKLAPIKGKAVNIVADLERDTVLADGGFKRLVSTGDSIQIDQKYTRAENYTPTCKHLFAANSLPVIKDATNAVFRRLMIIHFKNRIPEDAQDTLLDSKLSSEMSGILNWAVRGARDLYAAGGKWPRIRSSEALLMNYKLEQNPLHFFIEESGMVKEVPGVFVETEKLRKAMNEFDGGKPYGRRGFSRLLDAVAALKPAIRRGKSHGKSVIHGLDWSHGQTRFDVVK
jgi:P4 family phage/plasmid primase-like protien